VENLTAKISSHGRRIILITYRKKEKKASELRIFEILGLPFTRSAWCPCRKLLLTSSPEKKRKFIPRSFTQSLLIIIVLFLPHSKNVAKNNHHPFQNEQFYI